MLGEDRLVAGIWIRYPVGSSLEDLVRYFSSFMGEPMHQELADLPNGVSLTTVAWMNRTARFLLTRQRNDAGFEGVTVFMRDPRY